MLNLLKLFRWSLCLLLGMTVSGVVVSVSGQSTKTGGDNSQGSVWVNNSILEEAPYVNAEKVENRGIIEAATPDNVPFYFFNAKYFTNSGTVNIRKDFQFSTFSTDEKSGVDFEPKKAKVFHNHSTGKIISITDEFSTGSVKINAESIINKGLISAENAGVLHLEGDDVNLVRGGIEIKSGPDFEHPNGLNDFGRPLAWGYNLNYLNGSLGPYQERRFSSNPVGAGTLLVKQDWGVRDVFWGLRVGSAYNGSTPAGVFGFGDYYSFAAPEGLVWQEVSSPYSLTGKYTPPYGQYAIWDGPIAGVGYKSSFRSDFVRIGDEYHETYQGILLKNSGSEKVLFDGKFIPTYAPANNNPERFFYGAVASFTVPEGITNVIQGVNETRSIYVIDEHPNIGYAGNGLLVNSQETASTDFGMPQNFVVTRYKPEEYVDGIPGTYEPSFMDLYRGEQNTTTFNDSYYGFRITNVVSRLPFSELPNPDLENNESKTQSGLVRVKAKNLDLRNARIRAEGGIRIETEHLIGSTNAVLDSQNLSLNLGSTNGVLVITNIVQESVQRFTGGIQSYSVAWANNYRTTGAALIDREKIFFVEDPAAEVTVNLHYHFFVIDAFLNAEVPVTVTDLTVNSDKVLFKDPMNITELLSVNANSLSIHRDINLGKETFLGSGVYSKVDGQAVWDNKVAPNLENYINFASVKIPGQAKYGTDRDKSYDSWVNEGTTSAQDIFIDSSYVENSGVIETEATVDINAQQLVLQNGKINAGESLILSAENFKMRFQTNSVGAQLVLNVSNVLSDGGVGANNTITVGRGVVMRQKPTSGDLLGTEIIATADDFVSQAIDWNSDDHGVSVKGFENNAALGKLILKNGKLSKFEFHGSEEGDNAIYIDYLEFDGLTKDDISGGVIPVLDIKEGFKVYFAASNLPAEEIDGMYSNRLRWVKEYPGYNSSMPLYISGTDKTIRVNRSFRQSIAYDTDNDGIANGYDLSPFGNGIPKISSVNLDQDNRINIKWMGLPSSLYRIEYKEKIGDAGWKLLTEYYNDEYIVKQIAHQEVLSNKRDSKFYRVLYIE